MVWGRGVIRRRSGLGGWGCNEEEVKVLVCVRIVFLASRARFAVEELLTLST